MKIIMVQLLLLLFVVPFHTVGQNTGTVKGRVTDEKGRAVELANVAVKSKSSGVTTDMRGFYELRLPADTTIILTFSFIGFKNADHTVKVKSGEVLGLDVTLFQTSTVLPTAVVKDERMNTTGLNKLNPKSAQLLPTMGSGIEELIKTLPGVSSNNELSSQYTVRGGNFDENLVYVNGIEIYRPFLIDQDSRKV